jgi:hypothetical protein
MDIISHVSRMSRQEVVPTRLKGQLEILKNTLLPTLQLKKIFFVIPDNHPRGKADQAWPPVTLGKPTCSAETRQDEWKWKWEYESQLLNM